MAILVTECESDLSEDVDAVFDCKGDDESESISDAEASEEKVETDVLEFDADEVNDNRGVSLDAAVVVASVDCELL